MAEPPPRGYIDPNFPNPGGPDDASIIIYGYTPSIVVGVLGAVLFFLAGILHLVQLIKYKTWYFSTVMVGIVFVRLRLPSPPLPHPADIWTSSSSTWPPKLSTPQLQL